MRIDTKGAGVERSSPELIAQAVSHRFGSGPWLFEALDFTLRSNEVYALTGPSGSGKSTLLGLLAGWGRPVEGTVLRKNIGSVAWVFQNPHGVAGRRALDHVALPLLARGASHTDARRRARDGMERVGLEHVADAPFRDLSGGEAQRLMLARGLASKPDLLLVDEPTAQLDPATSVAVNAAIAAMAAHGTIAVVATHDAQTRDACTAVIDLVPHP